MPAANSAPSSSGSSSVLARERFSKCTGPRVEPHSSPLGSAWLGSSCQELPEAAKNFLAASAAWKRVCHSKRPLSQYRVNDSVQGYGSGVQADVARRGGECVPSHRNAPSPGCCTPSSELNLARRLATAPSWNSGPALLLCSSPGRRILREVASSERRRTRRRRRCRP